MTSPPERGMLTLPDTLQRSEGSYEAAHRRSRSGLLGILIGALTNVATGELPNMLPSEWRGYLWLAWVPLLVCIYLVVFLE